MKLENLFRALILFPFVLMPIYWFVDFTRMCVCQYEDGSLIAELESIDIVGR